MSLFDDSDMLGFTGTRQGMTEFQKRWFKDYLDSHHTLAFHHGDCVGADADAHKIAYVKWIDIVIHPCTLSDQRAFCEGARLVHPPLPPLRRNQNIVNSSTRMIAMPSSNHEELRSGTWATIRYARRLGKPLVVVGPKGVLE